MAADYNLGFRASTGKRLEPNDYQSCSVRVVFRGDRLAGLMKERGFSQSELARRVGVSQATVWKLIKEPSQGSKHLHKIARILATTPAYLSGETDDPSEGAYVPPTPEEIAAQMGLIKVEEIDLAIGMGAAFLDEAVIERVDRWMPEEWVRGSPIRRPRT